MNQSKGQSESLNTETFYQQLTLVCKDLGIYEVELLEQKRIPKSDFGMLGGLEVSAEDIIVYNIAKHIISENSGIDRGFQELYNRKTWFLIDSTKYMNDIYELCLRYFAIDGELIEGAKATTKGLLEGKD